MTTIVLSQPPTPTTTINSRKRTCSFSCSATPTAPKAKAPRMVTIAGETIIVIEAPQYLQLQLEGEGEGTPKAGVDEQNTAAAARSSMQILTTPPFITSSFVFIHCAIKTFITVFPTVSPIPRIIAPVTSFFLHSKTPLDFVDITFTLAPCRKAS
uniref:Uncharacterized protein n=1 Tax=Moniliophthora roreri TaxID=221103 RepID=A0A0W0EXJ1_MONRR